MTFSVVGIDTKTNGRVQLLKSARLSGSYIIGSTGTGKTGLLDNLIIQDIKQAIGVCLLNPHNDLTNAVLSRLPPGREQDVVFLDIADEEYPFGLNLFACSAPQSARAVQYVVDQVMHIFEKLFAVSRDTPLLIEYLRACTHTLVANPGYTMADIPLLLTNETCRRTLLSNVADAEIRRFWEEYDSMSLKDQREERSGILRRVREFLQPLTINLVGQANTTINLRAIMDEGKILLVKLDARLESVTSLIGSIIVAQILNAAYSRADLPVNKRRQFHLYADEFQRFSTEDFATLLTEARKFGIGTTIAHQFRDQLDKANRGATLSAANLVVFRVSGQDSEELAKAFDATPPLPEIIGQRPILTPVQDVIGHLVRRGHKNPEVSQFVAAYLVRLEAFLRDVPSDRIAGTGISFFSSEDVAEGARQLNQVLSACMRERSADRYIPALALLTLTLAVDDGGTYVFAKHVKEDFTYNFLGFKESARMFGAPAFLSDPQRVQAFLVRHESKRVADSVFRGHTVRPGEAFVKLLSSLRQTMEILAHEPILVDTGQHEPIYDKPRTYADVQNETASKLATLPTFTALARIATENSTVEYSIRTLAPERGLGKAALQERIERIQAYNRNEGYTRSRQEVEGEIQRRQAQCSQMPPLPGKQPPKPPEDEPPAISRQEPL
jgi:hypothetical protein